MRQRWVRVGLWALVLGELPLAVWAVAAPASWYRSFPGFGHHWLPPLGPYNDHLAVDFGSLTLGLATITVVAAVTMRRDWVLAAAAGWTVVGVPHLAFHIGHLEPYPAGDQVANLIGLTVAVLLPAAILVASLFPRKAKPRLSVPEPVPSTKETGERTRSAS
jgi:hypothetical protein